MTVAAGQRAARPLAPADLLSAWERGLPRSLAERGIVLLAAILPESSTESLLHLSIGERDVHLLHAHQMLFGPELDCVVSCPACCAHLELRIRVDDLLQGASPPHAAEGTGEVEEGGWLVRFRLIDSQDLIEASSSQDPTMARHVLLHRCVLVAIPPDGPDAEGLPPAGLPHEVEQALLEEMERRELVGSLDFEITCPECGHVSIAPFDILGYLWAEIEGWAHHTLREVHLLASAYGWGESDILALSAWRREAYLQMSGLD